MITYDKLDEAGKLAIYEFEKLLYRIRKQIEFQEMGLKQSNLTKFLHN